MGGRQATLAPSEMEAGGRGLGRHLFQVWADPDGPRPDPRFEVCGRVSHLPEAGFTWNKEVLTPGDDLLPPVSLIPRCDSARFLPLVQQPWRPAIRHLEKLVGRDPAAGVRHLGCAFICGARKASPDPQPRPRLGSGTSGHSSLPPLPWYGRQEELVPLRAAWFQDCVQHQVGLADALEREGGPSGCRGGPQAGDGAPGAQGDSTPQC